MRETGYHGRCRYYVSTCSGSRSNVWASVFARAAVATSWTEEH